MREKIISFYNPETLTPYFMFYVKEVEENLIGTIHLFCNTYEKTTILDNLSDLDANMIHVSLFVNKCLRMAETHLKRDVKVLAHNFYRKSENITYELDLLLKDLKKKDINFTRVKVL